ncbi:hypothetical protein ACFFU2_02930 [Halomonas alkalicola]|uniref:Uncharacterized protein n=1 Tax=Halomonas alkalicola TaxID=1930622 RepID=A0ABY9H5G9_9GAMM|nr:hypothetical protein [Halomonas alkalicola]WLI73730.1 hypothetical protein B6N23_01965 [Halomonas alkalicola]
MIKGLMWCFAILGVQLGLLRYIDLRVAAMPRLQDPSEEPGHPDSQATEAVASGGSHALRAVRRFGE